MSDIRDRLYEEFVTEEPAELADSEVWQAIEEIDRLRRDVERLAGLAGASQDDNGKWHIGDCNAFGYDAPCICDGDIP